MFTLSNAFFPYIGAPGLRVALDGGVVINNGSSTFIAAQTISLAANSTTYIFLNTSSIAVQSNTSGFTATNCYPIAIVTTANESVTTILDMRPDIQGGSSGGGGIPAGNDGDVQFNNAGSFGGSDNFFWDNIGGTLEILSTTEALFLATDNSGVVPVSTLLGIDNEMVVSGSSITVSSATLIDSSVLVQAGNTVNVLRGIRLSASTAGGGASVGNYKAIDIGSIGGGFTTAIGLNIGNYSNSGNPNSRAIVVAGGIIEFPTASFLMLQAPIVAQNDVTTGFSLDFSGITPGNTWLVRIPDSDSSTAVDTPVQAGKALASFNATTGTFGFVSVGSGTVTSVALTMPAIFSVGGSPVTTSGTLAVTLATETANTVWAGPTSGGASTPTFRALVTADMPAGTGTVTSFSAGTLSPLFTTSVATATTTPALSFSLSNAGGGTVFGNNTTGSATPAYTTAPVLGIPGTSTGTIALASSTASGKFTLTAPASASTPTLTLPTTANVLAGQFAGDGVVYSASLVTASAAGTLTLPSPSNQTANTVFAGPTSGGAATPGFRALVVADIPNTTITPIWNNLQNATGALTLANAGNATTFNQTSAVTWTWANTTAATSSVSQSSPIFSINGTYWTGAASATDSWTIQDVVANGTNGTSQLTFAHSGSTGAASVVVPAGTTSASGFLISSSGPGLISISSAILGIQLGSTTSTIRLYAGTTLQSLIAQTATNFGLQAGQGNSNCYLAGQVTTSTTVPAVILGSEGNGGNQFSATSGNQIGVQIGNGIVSGNGALRFAPTSGTATFQAAKVTYQINQTGGANGTVTDLLLSGTETALVGTHNALDIGTAGNGGNFTVNAAGLVKNYAAAATVGQGVPSEIVTVDLTAQTAAITATNLTASAPRTGMYRISMSATITTAGTTSILGGTNGFQINFTSPTDSVAKTTVAGNSITSAANTTGTAIADTLTVYAKTGTAIAYTFDYTSTGTAMAYELHLRLEAL